MLFVHVTGELIRDPAQKTSGAGKVYAHMLLKVGNGEGSYVVSALVFGEEATAALALERGDSVTVAGRGTLGIYQRQDGPTPSLSVFVNKLLAGKPEPKQKASREPKAKPEAEAPRQQPTRSPGAGGGHFDDMADDIPF